MSSWCWARGVDLANAVGQADAEGGSEPTEQGVTGDGQVGDAERGGRDGGRPGEGPAGVAHLTADALGLVGAGEVGDQAERAGDAGGDGCGGGDTAVLDVPLSRHPPDVGVPLAQCAEPGPVARCRATLEHAGGGEDAGAGADAEDVSAPLGLLDQPRS
jgi:hypothetical protein